MLTEITKKTYKDKIKSLITSLALLFLSIFVIGVIMVWFFQKINMPTAIAGALASQLSILVYGIYLFNANNESINNVLNKERSFESFWMGVKLTIPVLIVNLIVGYIFPYEGGVPESTQDVLNNQSFLLTFLFPVVIAPICEELAFRAGLKRALVDIGGWSVFMYAIISSVIFGSLHWSPASSTALAHVVLTTLMGVIYSITYLKTDNIYIPIVSHMIYNGIVVTLASFVQ